MLSGGADTDSAASGEPHEIPNAGGSSAKAGAGAWRDCSWQPWEHLDLCRASG